MGTGNVADHTSAENIAATRSAAAHYGPADTVLVSLDHGIAQITLHRPQAMNAITVELAHELHAALLHCAESARVIVIRGSEGNFSVGGDYHELQRLQSSGREHLAELFTAFRAACDEIRRLPVPVIAAVEGIAMAGGFELMQSCDFAVVKEGCRIADTHANHDMIPGGGGSQTLPRLVGRQRAAAHILTGDSLSAAEAVTWGLAYRSYPSDSFDEGVAELALKLASHMPAAVTATKELIWASTELPLVQGLRLEHQATLDHLLAPAAEASVQAFTRKDAND